MSTTPVTFPLTSSERVAVSSTSLFTTVTPVTATSVQCVYSNWTDWTSCTKTCGEGQQTRARNIIAGFCIEPLLEKRTCQIEPCPCIFTQDDYISTFQKAPPADGTY